MLAVLAVVAQTLRSVRKSSREVELTRQGQKAARKTQQLAEQSLREVSDSLTAVLEATSLEETRVRELLIRVHQESMEALRGLQRSVEEQTLEHEAGIGVLGEETRTVAEKVVDEQNLALERMRRDLFADLQTELRTGAVTTV